MKSASHAHHPYREERLCRHSLGWTQPRILISPEPALFSPQPPFPFIPPPVCSQSPGLPASFPASSWWHLASQLLLRRSLFCRLSLTFIMYRHHERASVFLAECCLSIHTTVYLPISYGGTVGLSLAFGWRVVKSRICLHTSLGAHVRAFPERKSLESEHTAGWASTDEAKHVQRGYLAAHLPQ